MSTKSTIPIGHQRSILLIAPVRPAVHEFCVAFYRVICVSCTFAATLIVQESPLSAALIYSLLCVFRLLSCFGYCLSLPRYVSVLLTNWTAGRLKSPGLEMLRRFRGTSLPRLTLFGRSVLLVAAELLANAACWIVCAILFGRRPETRPILSLALLAWVSAPVSMSRSY